MFGNLLRILAFGRVNPFVLGYLALTLLPVGGMLVATGLGGVLMLGLDGNC